MCEEDGMEEWKECKLGDIVEINPTESLKKGTVAKKIGMDVLQPYCRAIPSFSFEPYTGGTKFKNGDTIMARITPCLENGKTAMVNILDDNEIGFGSTEYIVFRAKNNITDPYFVYYLVTSDCIRNPAIKSMVGSSGRQRVQTDVVANLSVKVPPLPTQQKIAAILSSLDDKIELNNKINTNLEQQAQALFKNWFVDFEPFGGKMPEGWKEADIYSIANIIYGSPFASKLFNTEKNGKPIIRIRDLKDQHSDVYTPEERDDAYLIQPKDIVVGMDGEFRPYIWGSEPGWLNQRVCVFENKRPKGKVFLYFSIKPLLDVVEKTQVATTVIHIGKKDFDKFKITLPTEDILDKFDELTNPILDQIVANRLENRRLAELRDALLPKLMNGEIEV